MDSHKATHLFQLIEEHFKTLAVVLGPERVREAQWQRENRHRSGYGHAGGRR